MTTTDALPEKCDKRRGMYSKDQTHFCRGNSRAQQQQSLESTMDSKWSSKCRHFAEDGDEGGKMWSKEAWTFLFLLLAATLRERKIAKSSSASWPQIATTTVVGGGGKKPLEKVGVIQGDPLLFPVPSSSSSSKVGPSPPCPESVRWFNPSSSLLYLRTCGRKRIGDNCKRRQVFGRERKRCPLPHKK